MAPEPLNLRPAMRRKSSAQNLLSSFKTNPHGGPPSASIGSSSQQAQQQQPLSTPTTTTPIMQQRDWDAQSETTSNAATLVAVGSPALGGSTQDGLRTVDGLRDLVQKRIITLTYMRNIHEGRSHWFHTILMTRAEMDKVFHNTAMKKRTYRFAILGMSLSNLLEINHPQDLLRGLINTLTEYEQSKEDSDKPKMQRLFKTKTSKRQGAGGFAEYSVSSADPSETSYLMTPHMPFALDYHQTLLSLLDVLSEVYNKISKILGPSPFPHASQHMMGPLGLLSPHPGVSYLFTGPAIDQHYAQTPQGHTPTFEGEGSLWGIANGSNAFNYGSSPPASWTPALGEMVSKVDGKLKKITSGLLKELDTFARNGIKDELASLDPLLRNIAVADDGREQFDFEGTV